MAEPSTDKVTYAQFQDDLEGYLLQVSTLHRRFKIVRSGVVEAVLISANDWIAMTTALTDLLSPASLPTAPGFNARQ